MVAGAEIALSDMPYARGARYDAKKGCLPGTRRELIEEITEWVNSDAEDVPRVFFLSGMAGLENHLLLILWLICSMGSVVLGRHTASIGPIKQNVVPTIYSV
jgi:hypothetical protein